MRSTTRALAGAALILFVAASLTIARAGATPALVKVQGFLSDMSGGPKVPADGVFSMSFELFDDPFTGLLIRTVGPLPVAVSEGHYTVELAFEPDDFQGTERWIQITVEGEVLSPRLRVGSTPFAYVAENVDGYDGVVLEESAEIAAVESGLQTQIDGLTAEIGNLPIDLVPGDGWNALYRNANSGLLDATADLTYTPRATLGAFLDFDASRTHPLNKYQTMLRWFPVADLDDTGAALDPTISFGSYCSDSNHGTCQANGLVPCDTDADCPEGDTCLNADPQGACNWISRWCFNCGDNTSQQRRSTTRHMFSMGMASHFWEVGSCNPAGDSCVHQVVNWEYRGTDGRFHKPFLAELRVSGICEGGGRDGEVCFPDGQLGGCPGGTCSKIYDTNRFAWYANGRWGSCMADPDIRCDNHSQCPGSECTTSPTSFGAATFQINPQADQISAKYPFWIELYESFGAGDLSQDERALSVVFETAPAGDVDGIVTGASVLTRMTQKSDPGGQLAQMAALDLINQVNADDNDADIGNLLGISIVNDLNYAGASGGCCTDDGSDNDVGNLVGIRYLLDVSNSVDTGVFHSSGLWIQQPAGPTSAVSVNTHYGIRIDDQVPSALAGGTWGQDGMAAIDIQQQDSAGLLHDPARGNLRFWSQDHDSGHIQFGLGSAQHLWSDGSTLRFKDGPPATADDGGRLFYGECGAVAVNPGSIAAQSHGSATAPLPAVAGDGVCSCTLDDDFAPGLLFEHCRASAGELLVRLFNVTGAPINAAGQTVEYCCFEN